VAGRCVRDEAGVSTDVRNNAEAEKSAALNNDAEAEKFAASKIFSSFSFTPYLPPYSCAYLPTFLM
jgi:hypothetical protein